MARIKIDFDFRFSKYRLKRYNLIRIQKQNNRISQKNTEQIIGWGRTRKIKIERQEKNRS